MEEVSFRAMKIHEFNDAVYYQVACDCGSEKCNTCLEFEYDNESDMIFLNIYKDLAWASQWHIKPTWYWKFVDYWKRIKCALRILFTGYIKVEESFVIRGGDHMDSFIHALKEGKEKIESRMLPSEHE